MYSVHCALYIVEFIQQGLHAVDSQVTRNTDDAKTAPVIAQYNTGNASCCTVTVHYHLIFINLVADNSNDVTTHFSTVAPHYITGNVHGTNIVIHYT